MWQLAYVEKNFLKTNFSVFFLDFFDVPRNVFTYPLATADAFSGIKISLVKRHKRFVK